MYLGDYPRTYSLIETLSTTTPSRQKALAPTSPSATPTKVSAMNSMETILLPWSTTSWHSPTLNSRLAQNRSKEGYGF